MKIIGIIRALTSAVFDGTRSGQEHIAGSSSELVLAFGELVMSAIRFILIILKTGGKGNGSPREDVGATTDELRMFAHTNQHLQVARTRAAQPR